MTTKKIHIILGLLNGGCVIGELAYSDWDFLTIYRWIIFAVGLAYAFFAIFLLDTMKEPFNNDEHGQRHKKSDI